MRLTKIIFGLLLMVASSCQNDTQQTKEEGEHLVFKDSLGHVLTRADLANSTGQVNYEVLGTQVINPAAKALHEEARTLGQAGHYDAAISKLEEAIKIQPTWAYPTYDLAYTYLLKGNYENALKFYKTTDELEPKGFFTAKTALYALEGEKAGKFPQGLYATYLKIEWANNVATKLEMANAITQKFPDFAPAWKTLTGLLEDNKERLNAIEQGLSKDPDEETKGILLINKAAILDNDGKKNEAKQLLGALIFSPDVTTGNLELAKFTLRTITEKQVDPVAK